MRDTGGANAIRRRLISEPDADVDAGNEAPEASPKVVTAAFPQAPLRSVLRAGLAGEIAAGAELAAEVSYSEGPLPLAGSGLPKERSWSGTATVKVSEVTGGTALLAISVQHPG